MIGGLFLREGFETTLAPPTWQAAHASPMAMRRNFGLRHPDPDIRKPVK